MSDIQIKLIRIGSVIGMILWTILIIVTAVVGPVSFSGLAIAPPEIDHCEDD